MGGRGRRSPRRAPRLLGRRGHGGAAGRGGLPGQLRAAGRLPVSAAGPRAAATALAAGSFLVETDSPYLGPDRDGRNEPTTVLRVVAELARLRGEAAEAVVAPIREAYRALIGVLIERLASG